MKKLLKYFLAVLVAVWYVYLFTNRNFFDVLDQKKEIRRLKRELSGQNSVHVRLREEFQKVSEKEYIESLIRKNLNKSYKDEIIFKII